MKLGMFQMPLHPPGRLLQETLKENGDKVIYADELGFTEVWVGEHFSATTEPISAPMMYMASLLNRTRQIKFATGVVSLPNHHPAIVAAEAAQFDHLSDGRFIFGIGPSGLASDHELFANTDAAMRGERLMESIEIIQKIWAQDPPYDIKGKHWHIKLNENVVPAMGIGFMPKPLQEPHPPIAMSAMSPFSSSMKTAGEKGWIGVSANFCAEYIVGSHWKKYVEGCESAGRKASGDDWRVARNVVVAETDEQALEWVMDPKGGNYYYFGYLIEVMRRANYTVILKENPDDSDETLTVANLTKNQVIYGSSKTVTEKLAAFREKVGPFGTLLLASMDASGRNRHREWETMRRLSHDVAPALAKMK